MEAVSGYFKALFEDVRFVRNSLKVVIVGQGGAGKTRYAVVAHSCTKIYLLPPSSEYRGGTVIRLALVVVLRVCDMREWPV